MIASSKCEWCSKSFTPKPTTKGRFCCQKCANSWVSNYNKEKRIANIRKTAKRKSQKGEYKRVQTEAWIVGREKTRVKSKITWEKKWMNTPTEQLSRAAIKRRLLIEQKNKCSICNIKNEWNGKSLTFELDHINGDNQDNRRNNIRLLCPNCHSQTATFRRPKTSKKEQFLSQ